MSNMNLMIVGATVTLCMFIAITFVSGVTNNGPQKASDNTQSGDIAFPDDLGLGRVKGSYHHHHHHHPGFSYNNHPPYRWDDDGDNVFEEGLEADGFKPISENTSLQIPLDYIQNLNKFNVTDLLINYVEEDEETPIIQDRFGEDGQERNAAVMPKGAACMPELKTVQIVTSNDPSVLYIPQCTRVERCGGCCSHALLSCQPQEVEYINYKVIKTQYTGGKKLKSLGKEIVLVEKHTKCKCDCRVQAEDCNRYQEYHKNECRCACTNHDEEKKCYKHNQTKLWNPDLCACQCRETLQCSTGTYFDQNECRCLVVPMKRRFASYERRSYEVEPAPAIVPLDEA